jgi:hypothetical protein
MFPREAATLLRFAACPGAARLPIYKRIKDGDGVKKESRRPCVADIWTGCLKT